MLNYKDIKPLTRPLSEIKGKDRVNLINRMSQKLFTYACCRIDECKIKLTVYVMDTEEVRDYIGCDYT